MGRGVGRVLFSAPEPHVTAVTLSSVRLFAMLDVLSGNLINSGAFGSFSTRVSMATCIKTLAGFNQTMKVKLQPERLNSACSFRICSVLLLLPLKKVTHNTILQRSCESCRSQTPTSALLNVWINAQIKHAPRFTNHWETLLIIQPIQSNYKNIQKYSPLMFFNILANRMILSLLTTSTEHM